MWLVLPALAHAQDVAPVGSRNEVRAPATARAVGPFLAERAARGGPGGRADLEARTECVDARGRRWSVGERGVLLDGRPVAGLPREDATCVAPDRDGFVWLGTGKGAVRTDGATAEYRQGPRWLVHDEVRAVAVDGDGHVRFVTALGPCAILREPLTLAGKAAFFDAEVEARHRRTDLGFVDHVLLERPHDLSLFTQQASDNDGLWTGMWGAAQCFAWAATKDPAARERARQAFRALRFLSQVTQGGPHPAPPGFPARTVVPAGEEPSAEQVEARDREKRATRDRLWKVLPRRWLASADGRWLWKCDTSSDELDGHFFFYAQYHDLVCETDAERAEVAEVVAAILGHLEAHGWRLVDWDGTPTRWANFAPGSLNHDPDWVDERGLNSMSLLSYLTVGAHVTGDARWTEHRRRLIAEHGYAMNVLQGVKPHRGPGTGNHSDDEMAVMGLYDLLLYEADPALRQVWAQAFARLLQVEAPERNPFFAFAYAGVCTGARASTPWGDVDLSPPARWLDDAVDALVRFPLDRRDWPHDNTGRADVVVFDGDDGGPRVRLRDGRALPVDERWFSKWAHDPWQPRSGHDGRCLADGAPYLLAWALARYHGLVRE